MHKHHMHLCFVWRRELGSLGFDSRLDLIHVGFRTVDSKDVSIHNFGKEHDRPCCSCILHTCGALDALRNVRMASVRVLRLSGPGPWEHLAQVGPTAYCKR